MVLLCLCYKFIFCVYDVIFLEVVSLLEIILLRIKLVLIVLYNGCGFVNFFCYVEVIKYYMYIERYLWFS